jgi:poly(A) polymerase
MIVRAVSRENFTSDPLRLVRAYRFRAQLDGRIEPETLSWIKELSPMIISSSAERISRELEIIMHSERAAKTFMEMVESRIIFKIIPELLQMEGVKQPAFHHLNVMDHCLETLNCMESLIKKPGLKFPLWEAFSAWLKENPQKVSFLKWSAIFHDIGKPKCKGFKKGRTTFYHHDHKGAEFVEGIAARLRWPVKQMQFVARMVKLHMRPFHLLNDLRAGRLSKRAMRRLALETGDDLLGLFLLAMADSMAGCGPLKPEGLDAELAVLSERIYNFYTKEFKPLKAKKPLLTGHDIQRFFGISPGPLIGKALDALEEARVEGEIKTREEARAWMGEWLENNY